MTEGPQSLKSFLPGPFQKQAASRSQLRAAHTSVTHGPQQGLSRSKMCFHFLVSLGQLGANITTDSALPIGTKALQSWFSCSALLSPKTQENRSMTFKSRRCILSLLLPSEEGPVALLTLRPLLQASLALMSLPACGHIRWSPASQAISWVGSEPGPRTGEESVCSVWCLSLPSLSEPALRGKCGLHQAPQREPEKS